MFYTPISVRARVSESFPSRRERGKIILVLDSDRNIRRQRRNKHIARGGRITFDRVSFGYNEISRLKGVSMILPGQMSRWSVLRVGKTTIISLNARFYAPASGKFS
jgi:ABC-type multidrug transport system fused ATPase/permease subunit